MKCYKVVENGVLTMTGASSVIPPTGIKLTEEQYNAYQKLFADAPENTFESVYYFDDATSTYLPRERTEEEKIEWYVMVVQTGIVALEDVPEEYRAEVKARLPKTEAEELLEEVANYDYE